MCIEQNKTVKNIFIDRYHYDEDSTEEIDNNKSVCLSVEKRSHSDGDKGTYAHWMLKEIMEQNKTVYSAMGNGGRLCGDSEVKLGGMRNCMDVQNIIILACGSSLHAGRIAIRFFQELCNYHIVKTCDAGEFDPSEIPRIGNTALILISQSGETRDVYNCIEIGRKHNCILMGVINVVDSMIAREVDFGCYLNAGREVSVASTKSFTSQIVVLCLMAIFFAQCNGNSHAATREKRKHYMRDCRNLQKDVETTLANSEMFCQQTTDIFSHILKSTEGGSCFVLGQGRHTRAAADEAALKLKEVSYLHAEGASASSLKHGSFALLNDTFPVILLAPSAEKSVGSKKNFEHIS